jgi:hypothetical protein
VRFLFSLTALAGAFLLFLVEPMFARMVLPLLGGAPAVWNTCLVFYQLALLGGYLYAHAVRHRTPRQQVIVHGLLLAVAAVVLPLAVRGLSSAPSPSSHPIAAVFWLLLVSIGLPFFVLSATGPLIQRWFAARVAAGGGSPYALYAASNAGSFLALLGYPIVIEPLSRLHTQSVGWTAGYGVFAVLMIACGMLASASVVAPVAPAPAPSQVAPPKRSRKAAEIEEEPDPWADRLRWLGLAAVPSTLMMSVTTFISTDVASVPMLWVVPLALYLLTLTLAFAEHVIVPGRLVSFLFPFAVVVIIALVIMPAVHPAAAIATHLIAFFVIAMACHQELAASRPPTEALTEFYLWLSAGGAAGGLFNALVAPVLFVTPHEYPLAALSACLMLPDALPAVQPAMSNLRRMLGQLVTIFPVLLVPVGVTFVHVFDERIPHLAFTRYAIIFWPPCIAAFLMRRRPLRMGIALALVVVAGAFVRFDNRVPIHVERSFFGVHRIMFTGRERLMLSGTTNHGVQSIDPRLQCEPLSYYSRGGPVGQLFETFSAAPRQHFGVVGLGTASLGAYAKPGQTWTFFEINPAVERLARDREYFTHLSACVPQATVVIGDARLKLAEQPDGAFDVLMLDAFSSDAIPVHLMTVEAMQLYFQKLSPHGLLVAHISNRFLDLAPVVGSVAREAGLVALEQLHLPTPEQMRLSEEITASRWTVIARDRADVQALLATGHWQRIDDLDGPVWTDDYSNVFATLHW